MKPVVLGFAGAIGSGKSNTSTAVAEALHWPRVSFGEYVRDEAMRRGLSGTRDVLQSIGASLIDFEIESFCRGVLSQVEWKPGGCLVIDGIRHIEVVHTIQRMVNPSKLLLVFLTKNEDSRKSWVYKRDTINEDQLRVIENHSTETQVQTVLAEIADLKVESDRPMNATVQEITNWVHQNMMH